jgi:hypothetical protein
LRALRIPDHNPKREAVLLRFMSRCCGEDAAGKDDLNHAGCNDATAAHQDHNHQRKGRGGPSDYDHYEAEKGLNAEIRFSY